MAHDDNTSGIDGHLFRLIATFEAAAMQQLGKIAHPLTGDVDVNLDGARDSIEMLDMVRRKTEGNLNVDERRLLDHVLYQLRMNYVDVSREGPEPATDAAGKTDGSTSGGEAGQDPAVSSAAEGDSEDGKEEAAA